MRFKILMMTFLNLMSGLMHANMMRDMAVMMGGQIGGSIANQTVSAEFNDMQTALTTDQSNINSTINIFATTVHAAQKKELNNVYNLFSNAQTNISNLLLQQQSNMSIMSDYLQKALDRQVPQIEYLTTPTWYDEHFTLATMYTPEGPVWKNTFPVGNWEYDASSDSFWQMSNVAMMQLDENQTPSADKAPNNSIFTEWFTRNQQYEIECEITLYQVSYPFFAGLIFNKARWISGDQPRLQKYRLFGLYGDATGNVQVCFTEATLETAGTTTAAPVWNNPLGQVLANSGVIKPTIDQTLLQNLKLVPATFHIKIKNSPTTIEYKIWPTSATEPSGFVKIQSSNPDLFLYHGIGFIAPGTIAEFQLMRPTELLFSENNKTAFQGQVQAFFQKNLTANFAANIDAALMQAGKKS